LLILSDLSKCTFKMIRNLEVSSYNLTFELSTFVMKLLKFTGLSHVFDFIISGEEKLSLLNCEI